MNKMSFFKEIFSYAEPVKEEDLIIGKAYFDVSFAVYENEKLPTIETLILVDIEVIKNTNFYNFSQAGLWHLNIQKENRLCSIQYEDMGSLFQFEKAIDVLLKFSLDIENRKKSWQI